MTETEQRLYKLEILVLNLIQKIDSVAQTAGQGLQNSLGGSGNGGSGGATSVVWIYTTSAGTARAGNEPGTATFQFVTLSGSPPRFTATGDAGDQGIEGYNCTGGVTPINAYGEAAQIAGKWGYEVIDCLNTTNPGPPANPPGTQSMDGGTGAMQTQAGDALQFN